jgi:tripartite-type tricarboxylate transporter receptor subunit TctC
MDRPILMPPGAPAERVEELRRAFHNAMTDPGFIAEAARQRIEIEEVSGEKVARILDEAFAMPPEVIKTAKDSMSLTGAGATE